MPTSEYVCNACHHAFEKFHSMKDEPIKKCPKCKKLKVRRLLGTGGGIIFKGTGFYHTDYKKSSGKSKQDATPPCGGDVKSCPKPDCGNKK